MDRMFEKMLAQVRRIPHGKVATYGDVAYAAGFPGAARQCAWALHSSDGTIPWQRVVGAGGKILCTGEMGLEQRLRLQGEGVSFTGLRVNLATHQHSLTRSQKTKPSKAARKRAAKR